MQNLRLMLSTCIVCCACMAHAADDPKLAIRQPSLIKGGKPVNGTVNLLMRVLTDESGSTYAYEDTANVEVSGGMYMTVLGDDAAGGSLARAVSGSSAELVTLVNGIVVSWQSMDASVLARARRKASVGEPLLISIQTDATRSVDIHHGELNASSTPSAGRAVEPAAVSRAEGSGQGNVASGSFATIGGGMDNRAVGSRATIGGGRENFSGGAGATVGGGYTNAVWGDYGTFVWSDAGEDGIESTGENQFLIQASGNVGIDTDRPEEKLTVAGNVAPAESGVHSLGSDQLRWSRIYADGPIDYAGLLSGVANGSTNLTLDAEGNLTVRGTISADGIRVDGREITEGASMAAGAPGTRDGTFKDFVRIDHGELSPNIVLGHPSNTIGIATAGAAISGGGRDNNPNTASGNFSSIGGGGV